MLSVGFCAGRNKRNDPFRNHNDHSGHIDLRFSGVMDEEIRAESAEVYRAEPFTVELCER